MTTTNTPPKYYVLLRPTVGGYSVAGAAMRQGSRIVQVVPLATRRVPKRKRWAVRQ